MKRRQGNVLLGIGLGVVAFHVVIIVFLLLFVSSEKPISQKKIVVETVVLNSFKSSLKIPEPVVAQRKSSSVASPTKKTSSQKINSSFSSLRPTTQHAEKKPTSVSVSKNHLLAAKENLARLEWIQEKGVFPKEVNVRKIEPTFNGERTSYYSSLVLALRKVLRLPEQGEVKMEITVDRLGKMIKVCTIESQSNANRIYLEKKLREVVFPPFWGELKHEREYTFTLTFTNDP